MALSTATITYDLANLAGVDFDRRRTKIWVSTNVDDGTVIDTVGNAIRVDSAEGTLADDGTGTVVVWTPGTGSNPNSWQTYVHLDYASPMDRTRKRRTFGPFTVTTSANLADLVEEQEVPAEYLTTITAALDAYVDSAAAASVSSAASATSASASATLAEAAADLAVDISGIATPDAVVAVLVEDTGSDTYGAAVDAFAPNRVTDHGAAKDDATNDAAAIQALIDDVRDAVRADDMNANNVVIVPAGIYEIGSTLTIPPYVKLRLDGTVIFRYTGSGTAVHITPLAADPAPLYSGTGKQQWLNTPMFSGGSLILLGTGAGTALAVGPTSDIGGTRPMARYTIPNVAIQDFDIGVQLNLFNHYIGTFENLHLEGNTVNVEVGAGGNTNSGENFRFNDCTFAGANEGFGIRSYGVDITFNACSFDFMDRLATIESTGYGNLNFVGCHIEGITPESDTPVFGSETGGVIVVDGTVEVQQVNFMGTTVLCEANDPLIRGPVTAAGTLALRPAGTMEAAGFFATDTDLTSSDLLVNNYAILHRATSRTHNLVPDPTFKLATTGSVTPFGPINGWAAMDWSGASTVEIVAAGGWEGGKILRVVLPTGTYFAMTAANAIPLRSLRDIYAGIILKSSGSGVVGEAAATYYRPDGTTVTTSLISLDSTALSSGGWQTPASLTNIGYTVPLGTMVSVKPIFVVSQNSGSSRTVDIGLVYFGQ